MSKSVENEIESLKAKPLKIPKFKAREVKPTPKKETEQERLIRLRAKLKKMEMQKLADGIRGVDRLAHIKSVGNGL